MYNMLAWIETRALAQLSKIIILAIIIFAPSLAGASYVTTLYDTPAIHLRGSDGNFYGADCSGSSQSAGKVIKVTTSGSATTLYSFPGVANDRCPSILVQGSDGNFN